MKKLALSAMSLLAAFSLAACSGGDSETIATMEGGEITKEDLYEAMKPVMGESMLQRLIIINVLDNEVGENNFAAEAEAETRTFMGNVGGEEGMLGIIRQMGFSTIKDYQDQILINMLMEEALTKRTEITDADIEAYYETYVPNITASHILVEDKATAEDIIKQLDEGADFATLAAEHSTDTSNAQNGGSLGSFGKGAMVAPFEEAAFALESGEYSKTPVESEFGFHVILVEENPEKGTLEEERENLREALLNEKLTDAAYLDETISAIMQDANIKISDDDLDHIMDAYTQNDEEEESSEADSSAESDTAESEASSAE